MPRIGYVCHRARHRSVVAAVMSSALVRYWSEGPNSTSIPLERHVALLGAPTVADDSDLPYSLAKAWAHQVDGERYAEAWLVNWVTEECAERLWKAEQARKEARL